MKLIYRVDMRTSKGSRNETVWRRAPTPIDVDCHLCHADQGQPCKQWGQPGSTHPRRESRLRSLNALWHGTARSGAVKLLRGHMGRDLHLAEDWQRADEYAHIRAEQRNEQPFLLLVGARTDRLEPDPWAVQECETAGIEGHAGQWLLNGDYLVLRVVQWNEDEDAWQEIPMPRENIANVLGIEL